MVRLLELLFQEGEVLHNGSAVAHISCSHACLLTIVLGSLDRLNEAVLTDGVRLNDSVQLAVALL